LDYAADHLLKKVFELNPVYVKFHSLLLAITFARILPYATTHDQKGFIIERIEFFAKSTRVQQHTG